MSSRSTSGCLTDIAVVTAVLLAMFFLVMLRQCRGQALRFIGDARDSSGVIVLTPAQRASRGAVWTPKRHAISGGFTASFSFRITDKGGAADISGANGGDGFAFVVQDDNPAAIGGLGFGLGYGWNDREPGIARSLAVEFDYWDDTGLPYVPSFVDFSAYHVAVQAANVPSEQNGAVQSYTRAVNTLIPATDDGLWHRVRISYTPPYLDIYLDSQRVLTWRGGLDTVIGSTDAYIGLTAATMSAWQRHEFTDLEIAPVGGDTVRWNRCAPDTMVVRDTMVIRDTVVIRDTLRMRDTVSMADTIRIRDTVEISHPADTVTMVDTLFITRTDTMACYIYRDSCWNAPLDTVCGGSERGMTALLYWTRFVTVAPNPASDEVAIVYEVGETDFYSLALYNSVGERVSLIDAGRRERGSRRSVTLPVWSLAPGIYHLELSDLWVRRLARLEVIR